MNVQNETKPSKTTNIDLNYNYDDKTQLILSGIQTKNTLWGCKSNIYTIQHKSLIINRLPTPDPKTIFFIMTEPTFHVHICEPSIRDPWTYFWSCPNINISEDYKYKPI